MADRMTWFGAGIDELPGGGGVIGTNCFTAVRFFPAKFVLSRPAVSYRSMTLDPTAYPIYVTMFTGWHAPESCCLPQVDGFTWAAPPPPDMYQDQPVYDFNKGTSVQDIYFPKETWAHIWIIHQYPAPAPPITVIEDFRYSFHGHAPDGDWVVARWDFQEITAPGIYGMRNFFVPFRGQDVRILGVSLTAYSSGTPMDILPVSIWRSPHGFDPMTGTVIRTDPFVLSGFLVPGSESFIWYPFESSWNVSIVHEDDWLCLEVTPGLVGNFGACEIAVWGRPL